MIDLPKLIANGHQGLDFGTVTYYVKKHEGEVTTVDTQRIQTEKVADNTKAMEIVLQLFKSMSVSYQSGNVTLTVAFDKGQANKVMVQDLKHETAKDWS